MIAKPSNGHSSTMEHMRPELLPARILAATLGITSNLSGQPSRGLDSMEDASSRLNCFLNSSRPDLVTSPSDDSVKCPEVMENKRYTLYVYGYISIVVVLLTIVTNFLVCLVLLQKHMRTPTNLLLVAMAISDTLTGLFPVPSFLYFYTFGGHVDYVPYAWCVPNNALTLYLPTVTHTASIWLTVALAAQRYIYVCHSQKAKSLCTVRNVMKSIAVIYALAVVSQSSRFVEYEYHRVEMRSLLGRSGDDGDYAQEDIPDVSHNAPRRDVIVGCFLKTTPFVKNNLDIIYSLYWWFRVLFIHLFPCVVLVILNSLLFNAMRTAQARRDVLLRQNRRTECHRLAESNLATLMLVCVVTLFLFVEFPLAILLMTMIYENTFNEQPHLLEEEERRVASLFINLCTLLSYPVNFFIYCGMSRHFRETFKNLFWIGGGRGGATGGGGPGGRVDGRGGGVGGLAGGGGGSHCQTGEFQMTRISQGHNLSPDDK